MKQPVTPISRYADGACVGVLLAIALVDVLAGPEVTLLTLFAAAPAFAASRATEGVVVGTGLFAGALAVALALHDHLLGSPQGFGPLLAVGLVTAFSAAAARSRVRHQHQLTRMRDVVGAAQQTIIEPLPATAGPARIAASYESAADAAQIGGDFYEVAPIRDGVRLVVGDVQGKGLSAVRTAAVVLAAFRESAPVASSLETVGLKMSCALARRGAEERFVTAVLAELSDDGTLTLVNYGHTAPLVLPEAGGVAEAAPDRPGMPLGLDTLGESRPGLHHRALAPGDRMLFHTDGLDEARDTTGRFYPLATRSGLLRAGSLATGLEQLRTDVHRHTAPASPADDSALLLLEYVGAPPSSSAHGRPGTAPGPVQRGCEKCVVVDCPIPTRLRPHPTGGPSREHWA
ncbi:PP2C family protein-serine/threonine phosphatase [Streptomyces sp. OspMP-M43]|uniref:PP2C family protein-serine/threonine phosphatase n=1 Tax=Streptomyces sp. OspMP-M43 TaxID=1839781 RepID=UPI00081B411A|nr:PP2C family protein-serine/threonine phosphatase [Streptomyces sp. OspMP-M43]SCD49672.1 Serine phosphatase RsbU, regulator of sigma subunit [Streptomyces sp. OspMP-M43]